MGEEIKIEIIRSTQNSLSKYIKKPPLTEKLLRKPPFRYLHDITTAVMRETGYLQGLYSQDELNAENIKDREAKIAFLEKLIAAVNLSMGINITARPNKIVAGLDVAKTNELLQAIGKALDKKVDSSKAVEQVITKKIKSSTQQKKENSKDKTNKESKTTDSKSRESRSNDTLKKKSKDKIKTVEKTETRRNKQPKGISPTKGAKPDISKESKKEVENENNKPEEENNDEAPVLAAVEEPSEAPTENTPEIEKQHDPEPKHDVKPPPPVVVEQHNDEQKKEKTKREKHVDKSGGLETQQVSKEQDTRLADIKDNSKDSLKSGEELKRPQSARAVHRKKVPKKPNISEDAVNHEDKKEEVLSLSEKKELSGSERKPPQHEALLSDSSNIATVARETRRPRTAARPASARPGAPRVRDRGTVLLKDTDNKEISEPVNLIVDSKDLHKDDDESLVTVEAVSSEAVIDKEVEESHLLVGDQGHLVSQILETQKELGETASSESGPESHKVDISWSTGRQEVVAREVEKLRSSIQSLTRAVNPLGKLIDFLQEDIDSMQTELETWVTTNQQLAQQLLIEQRLTDECIEPLSRQLEDIEQLVNEQMEEMSIVKANIIRNDERLTTLLKAQGRIPG